MSLLSTTTLRKEYRRRMVVNGVSISVEGFTMYPRLTGRIALAALAVGPLLSALAAYFPARGCARRPIVEALRGVD